MTQFRILQTFFPLFFFLLSLSACHKPSVPTKVAAAPTSSQTPTTPDTASQTPATPDASKTPITPEDPIASEAPKTLEEDLTTPEILTTNIQRDPNPQRIAESPKTSTILTTLTTPNPNPWEQLPHINKDWIKPSFYAFVTNTDQQGHDVLFPYADSKDKTSLMFRPQSGTFDMISHTPQKNENAIRVTFEFSDKIHQSSKKFTSHTYFNGQYTNFKNTHENGLARVYIRPGIIDTLKPTDKWYFIFIFRGTDKKDYQYRTPEMSIANAS